MELVISYMEIVFYSLSILVIVVGLFIGILLFSYNFWIKWPQITKDIENRKIYKKINSSEPYNFDKDFRIIYEYKNNFEKISTLFNIYFQKQNLFNKIEILRGLNIPAYILEGDYFNKELKEVELRLMLLRHGSYYPNDELIQDRKNFYDSCFLIIMEALDKYSLSINKNHFHENLKNNIFLLKDEKNFNEYLLKLEISFFNLKEKKIQNARKELRKAEKLTK